MRCVTSSDLFVSSLQNELRCELGDDVRGPLTNE